MDKHQYCGCMDEQCSADEFDVRPVSTDRSDGMLIHVDVYTCKACGRNWIRYTTDHEARAGWGRWFRGLLQEGEAEDITAESAYRILESLPWHFYGFSYYRTAGERSLGPVRVGGLDSWLKAA